MGDVVGDVVGARGRTRGPTRVGREGQTKRDKQVSAKFCGFLRKSAKNAPPKCCNSQNQRKLAKICEKTANAAPFVPFHLSLLIPLDRGPTWAHSWVKSQVRLLCASPKDIA